MHTKEISAATFDATVAEGIVLIDWWAPWCGPCRSFAPVYERAAAKHPDITFAKVNTDVEPELAGSFGIRAIPTLMMFRDGVPIFAQAGSLPPKALEELIEKARALDMDEVRRKIAAAEASRPGREAAAE